MAVLVHWEELMQLVVFCSQQFGSSQWYRKVITSNLVDVLNISGSQSFAQLSINCDDQS